MRKAKINNKVVNFDLSSTSRESYQNLNVEFLGKGVLVDPPYRRDNRNWIQKLFNTKKETFVDPTYFWKYL